MARFTFFLYHSSFKDGLPCESEGKPPVFQHRKLSLHPELEVSSVCFQSWRSFFNIHTRVPQYSSDIHYQSNQGNKSTHIRVIEEKVVLSCVRIL